MIIFFFDVKIQCKVQITWHNIIIMMSRSKSVMLPFNTHTEVWWMRHEISGYHYNHCLMHWYKIVLISLNDFADPNIMLRTTLELMQEWLMDMAWSLAQCKKHARVYQHDSKTLSPFLCIFLYINSSLGP
jgi:hypothetical protein